MLLAEVTVSLWMWMWIAGALLVGVLIGVVGTVIVRRGNDAEQRLRRLRRDFDQYQGEVGSHFSQTAEVLTRLRNDFSQLYHHTERGAAALVGEEALQRRLRELESGDGRHPTPPPDAEHVGTAASVLHASGSPRQVVRPAASAAERAGNEPSEKPTARAGEVEPATEAEQAENNG